MTRRDLLAAAAVGGFLPKLNAAPSNKILLIDGQNNHQWQQTTPVLVELLKETGLFDVDVATTPPKGSDMSGFRPEFSPFRAVLSNYNGDPWPEETQKAFESYVRQGGGFVSFHAADNSFPNWKEYNQMIALGGWEGRTEKDGPYLRVRDNKIVRDSTPGKGGHHGKRHAFKIVMRDSKHPISKGLPAEWMHHVDELYDSLRGPAENLHLLATAYSSPETGGTGEHEPMLLTVSYGKGRVFHTTLGHDVDAMRSVGFIVTLQRGTEWAATGRVTQAVPADFPTPEMVTLRGS